ncbi:MAG: AAA family ATPase [Bacteroidaceae bacterium]|nr:AAA family ATPase [Bacteroidaceae bacterium]
MRKKGFPYEYFDDFIRDLLIGGKSYITKGEEISEIKSAIDNVYKALCQKTKEGKDLPFTDAVKDITKRSELLVLNHALWLWCFPNSRKTQYELCVKNSKGLSKEQKEKQKKENSEYDFIPFVNVAGAGSGYVQTKTNGIRFIVYLFKQCFESCFNSFGAKKDIVIQECKSSTSYEFKVPDGVKNLLLHLCNPDEYEPIASTADKQRIIKKCEEIGCVIAGDDDDKKLKSLRKDIFIKSIIETEGTFYSKHFPLLWKGESVSSTLSRVQLLEYKQAMVLYGPPGTGKTYTAMELAKEILVRSVMKSYKKASDKQKCKDCIRDIINAENATEKLCDKDNILSKYIYYLQFHINYNYEDFIAGQTMGKEGIETKEGFIFNIIKKAKEDSSMPYIVILDEMNRVDVSRVFGELFTAIEKRNTDVRLTLKKNVDKSEGKEEGTKDNEEEYLVLNVPDNVYFIGTMNEIDFSLERIDFALRRRFIWERHDYSEDSLESIINSRLENIGDDKNVNIDDFITCSSAVNKLIDKEDSLGPNYHIGHAFFAEVADIYKNLKESSSGANNWNQARNILWEISILPTLDAYCGSMDKTEKKTFIDNCKKAYNGNSSELGNEEAQVEESDS